MIIIVIFAMISAAGQPDVFRERPAFIVLLFLPLVLGASVGLRHLSLAREAARSGRFIPGRSYLFSRAARRYSSDGVGGAAASGWRHEKLRSGWITTGDGDMIVNFRGDSRPPLKYSQQSVKSVVSVTPSPSPFFTPVMRVCLLDGEVLDLVIVKSGVSDLFGVSARDIRRFSAL